MRRKSFINEAAEQCERILHDIQSLPDDESKTELTTTYKKRLRYYKNVIKFFEHEISVLPIREQIFMRMYYIENMPANDIAEKVGYARRSVDRILASARAKMTHPRFIEIFIKGKTGSNKEESEE